jgi:hypothetical protein
MVPIEVASITSLDLAFTGELVANTLMSTVIGDFNGNNVLDTPDVDTLTLWARRAVDIPDVDLDDDGRVSETDRNTWIESRLGIYYGDANLDGEFNSGDLIRVFQAGQYEDGQPLNSVWSTGDWSGDGEFSSGDFLVAFQQGGYEKGPRGASAVAEPQFNLCLCGALALTVLFTKRKATKPF